jgi:hypothetical protein
MQYTHISPEELGKLIAKVSLSDEDKLEIINSIPYLNPQKIEQLYENLLNLYKKENEIISQVQKIDLKYKIQLESELEKLNNNNN